MERQTPPRKYTWPGQVSLLGWTCKQAPSTHHELFRSIYSNAAVFTLLLAVGTAHAAGFEPGVFIGFDIGKSSCKQTGVNSSESAFGLKLGYQARGYFGLELYGRSLSFQLDGPHISADCYPDDHFGVAAVATHALPSEFNLYSRLGLGRTQLRSPRVGSPTRHRNEASLGVGAAYLMTPKWQVSLEAARFNKSEITLVTPVCSTASSSLLDLADGSFPSHLHLDRGLRHVE